MKSWGLLGALGVVLGGLGGRLVALWGPKGYPRSDFGAILGSFWKYFQVENGAVFVISFWMMLGMVLGWFWGRFVSNNLLVFELENGLGEKVFVLKNIGFTSVKHRFLRF